MNYTKKETIFLHVCEHFKSFFWYYNRRKNPNTLYINFLLVPISKKNTFSFKKAAERGLLFYFN